MSKNRLARALTLWVTAALLWAGPSFADHDTIPSEGLEQLKSLSDSTVTVSGISSGAFFAHQFHVAHSDLVKGAGIVAGGPYACAEQIEGISPPLNPFNPFLPNPIIGIIPKRIVTAFAVCTRFDEGAFRNTGWTHPANPAPKESEKIARQAEAARKISKLSNLADSRVWVFASQDDKLVPLSTVEALKGFYEEMGLVAGQGLKIEPKPDAAHGMPIKVLPVEGPHCSQPDPAFLIKCDYGAAELLLRHLYDGSFASSSTNRTPGRLVRFDQRPFFDQTDDRVSMANDGFMYIPESCNNGSSQQTKCRLHVAFHGCEQYADKPNIHRIFIRDAGYNPWADINNIVVIYPQTRRWTRAESAFDNPLVAPLIWQYRAFLDPLGIDDNPKGCWDWWGYSGEDYHTQSGKQVHAVREMIRRMTGK